MQNKTNGLAIAGFCVSIASLFIDFICIVAVIGLVLSCVARSQINQTGASGKGLATAGIVLGIISIVVGIAGLAML